MKTKHSHRIPGLKSFLRMSALEQFGKCLIEERYEHARDALGMACRYGATNRDIQAVMKSSSRMR